MFNNAYQYRTGYGAVCVLWASAPCAACAIPIIMLMWFMLQINEAQEAAEMATLDREMAEEQLEITRQELAQLKEQVDTRDI